MPARAPKGQQSSGLRTGWRTIRSLPALGWLVTGLTLSNLATGLLQAAGPVIVVQHFGQSTTAVGLVWSAAAAATLLSVAICRFALDRLGLWPVGAVCAALASLACLAAKKITDPKPDPSEKPTHKPTPSPSSPGKPTSGTSGGTPPAEASPTPDTDSSSVAAAPVGSSTPTGALARTGADATPWLIGGAAVLIAVGGGSLLLARRNGPSIRADRSTDS